MKNIRYFSLPLILLVLATRLPVFAQTGDDARDLIKEGVKLNTEKKYEEAIAKYREALKLDTGNLFADYQLALSLFSADKGIEGIPYLNRIITSNSALRAAAFDLLGLISFKNKDYSGAERYAIAAIKLDPAHAGTLRMYALVCFHQNKRAAALMGFCRFILLEPNTARSAEAFGNIQHILQGGTLKAEPGEMTSHAIEANTYALNLTITQAVAACSKNRYATAADLLAAQLTAIFNSAGNLAQTRQGDDFFRQFMASYFLQLAQSPNMAAFARLISQSKPESAKWIADNPKQIQELNDWLKQTPGSF